jgi:hypothetical protein
VSKTLIVDGTSLPNTCPLQRLTVPQVFDLHFHNKLPVMSRGYNQQQNTREDHSKFTTVAAWPQGRSTTQKKSHSGHDGVVKRRRT